MECHLETIQQSTTFKFDVTNGDELPDVSKKLVSNRVHSLILITAGRDKGGKVEVLLHQSRTSDKHYFQVRCDQWG